MPVEIAAIVEPGQLVGDRERQRVGDAAAQFGGVALAADLRADARGEFVALDRAA